MPSVTLQQGEAPFFYRSYRYIVYIVEVGAKNNGHGLGLGHGFGQKRKLFIATDPLDRLYYFLV